MTDFWTRITELSRLQPGWLDGEGLPPTEQALKAAGRIATALPDPPGEERIRVYPTPAGGVQLEWRDANLLHSITVGPDLRLDLMTVDRNENVRTCSCGRTPDPGICRSDCGPGAPVGGHCSCVHTPKVTE